MKLCKIGACKLSAREGFAVLLALVSLAGVLAMFLAEGGVELSSQSASMSDLLTQYAARVLPSLQKYSLAIGAVMVAVSISYILLGHEEEISTVPGEEQRK
jgi:hypothetical protein